MYVCICAYVDECMHVYMCTTGHLWKPEDNLQPTGTSALTIWALTSVSKWLSTQPSPCSSVKNRQTTNKKKTKKQTSIRKEEMHLQKSSHTISSATQCISCMYGHSSLST